MKSVQIIFKKYDFTSNIEFSLGSHLLIFKPDGETRQVLSTMNSVENQHNKKINFYVYNKMWSRLNFSILTINTNLTENNILAFFIKMHSI